MNCLTPLKAARAKCLECAGGRPSLVRKCDSEDCPLYLYRFGRNPARKGIGGHIDLINSSPALKGAVSARVFEDGSQGKSKDTFPGDLGLKSA